MFAQRSPSSSLFSRNPSSDHTPRSTTIDESLGLRLIRDSQRVDADIIFVHGLGGNSQKTFTNPQGDYWPGDWLPLDRNLGNVRVHAFGYHAAVREGEKTVWDIKQFAKSLLCQITMSPHLRRGDKPIIFVAHSMGGLVIKQMYILACQDPHQEPLARRIKSMIFLATPHGGSDSAGALYDLLRLTSGTRLYISELEAGSSTLQDLNENFLCISSNLLIWSFYETRKMRMGPFEKMIVPHGSAVMGIRGEMQQGLDADHRTICKFSSMDDANYVAVRDALASVVGRLSN